MFIKKVNRITGYAGLPDSPVEIIMLHKRYKLSEILVTDKTITKVYRRGKNVYRHTAPKAKETM
jgi:hypothetical protein